MSEDMLGHISLSELRGLRDQVEDRLVGKNSQKFREELKSWFRGESRLVKNLLRPIRTLTIPAQPAVTTSLEYFKKAGVVWMSENAKRVLLNRKVEQCGVTELRVSGLTENSFDVFILAELGDRAEVLLTQFVVFLNQNRKRLDMFIFYVQGAEGTHWTVYAYWDAERDGWFLSMRFMMHPLGWNAEERVVSRN